tara:strand:- start:1101 stop:1868 length:768 start_codon:yes stop_codon:yes gene_type:complete
LKDLIVGMVKSWMKRGQVTVILIVAIVIVVAILLVYFLTQKSSQSAIDLSKIDPEFRPLYKSLSNCLEDRANDALLITGLSGGYIEPKKNFLETNLGLVSYGLKNNKNVLISKEKLEDEISNYIDDSISFCVDSISFEVEFGESNTRTEIKGNKVIVNPRFKITVSSGNKSVVFDQYPDIEIPVKLGHIIDIANGIIEKQKQTGDQISLTYLSDFDVNVIFDYVDDKTLLYIVYDEDSKIEDIPYSFLFLAEMNK